MSRKASKVELKHLRGDDTSKLAAISDLASLKADIDKLDVDKLKTISVGLSKLSNVVNSYKLVAKLNNKETSGFVLKPDYTLDKLDPEKLQISKVKYLVIVVCY